ncbi:MAG TPA: MarR family transcriptional regulator [Candidatus Thermoplasmatota archaeon]|nr:MarR family transcriptional regulator [Candidatus Thermoplasmatota archaeon]
MRALLVATVLALALLGQTSAADERSSLPQLVPPGPDVPVEAPAMDAPPLEAPPVAAPELPGFVPGEVEGIVPEAPARRPVAFEPGDLGLPPATTVAATTAVGGALALVGFALYSRLSRAQILDHERRDEVFKLVRAEPGISLTDVAQRCGLGWGTTVYHLDRLERAGFVASERSGGRRLYFPVGAVAKDARPSLGALQQETTRSVASFVAQRPGATQSELAEALGLTASAASKQVSKLESVGLVRREREWKTVRLHPEPKLAELLAPTSSPAPFASSAMPALA